MSFVERTRIESSLPHMSARRIPRVPVGCVAAVSMLESLRQGFGGAGHRDQMHVIRHQAVTQQSKTVQVGVLPQQLEVGNAIAVAGQNYLPGVPTLRNMMGNINQGERSGPWAESIRKDWIRSGNRREISTGE